MRRASIIAVLGAVSVVLAACSSGSTATDSSTDATPTSDESQASEGTAAPSPVTMTIWSPENRPDDAAAHAELIQAFESANPDIKVELVTTTWDDHFSRLAAAKAAGNVPDIAYTWMPNTVSLLQQGTWEDVSDVWAAVGGEAAFPAGQAKALCKDGACYAVPFVGYPHGLWYRKDLLESAGLQPPKTLDELLEAARKLTTPDRKGICLFNKGLDAYYVLDLMLAAGAETFNADGTVAIDSPATREVLQFIKTVNDEGLTPDGWTALNMDDAKLPFLADKCAMKIDSTSFANTIATEHADDFGKYGFVSIPLAGGSFAGWAGASSYAIPVGAQHADAAKRFLEFLATPENYQAFMAKQVLGFAPMVTSVAQGDALYSEPRLAPYADFLRGAASAADQGSALVGSTDPAVADKTSKVYNEQVYSEMGSKIANGESVDDVISWSVDRINELTAQ